MAAAWIDPADVVLELGHPVPETDARLTLCIDAAAEQVARWRPDLRPALEAATPSDARSLWPDVYAGTTMYAALLVQSRATPAGFPGVDLLTGAMLPPGPDKMGQVRALVRPRLVIG